MRMEARLTGGVPLKKRKGLIMYDILVFFILDFLEVIFLKHMVYQFVA